ncbi:MAG: type II toxin-antitoxin system VapC family toxin [Chloroflexi bacterium]|nr:type II toxin-antitoxin system VapC family toxin [Chloroflexota bacterium]
MVGTVDVSRRFKGWIQAGIQLTAPMLWPAEIVSSVRFSVYRRSISIERGRIALEDLLALPVDVTPTSAPLCRAAFEWAGRLGQARAYDAFYLALAQELGAPFWTADRRLVNGARQAGVSWVHWIGEGDEKSEGDEKPEP